MPRQYDWAPLCAPPPPLRPYAPVLRLQGRRDGGTKIVTENMDLRFFKLNRVSLASLNLLNVG